MIETVIAIGVLAVLVAAFFAVFFPATEGIRRSLSIQEADRLTSALEQGVSNFTQNPQGNATQQVNGVSVKSGFEKAYALISSGKPLFVYSYRTANKERNADGTLKALIQNNQTDLGGLNYISVPVMRSLSIATDEPLMSDEFKALEGRVFIVKLVPMSLKSGVLTENANNDFTIKPMDGTAATGNTAADYPDAVITFAAKFYEIPTSDINYLKNTERLTKLMEKSSPIFTRNMAVRR